MHATRSVRSADREGKPHSSAPRAVAADVVGIINRAGGIASLAHPGLLKRTSSSDMIDAG